LLIDSEVYDTDPLIRFSDRRQIILWSFELPFNIAFTAVILFMPAMLVTLVFFAFLGILALPILPLTIAAGIWFIHSRSKKGAKTRQWQTLMDSRTAKNGSLMLAGEVMEINSSTIYELQPASVLVGAPEVL